VTLRFVAPPDLHGVFNMTLEAVSRETATGGTATSTLPITVTIAAEADAPTVPDTASRVNEDQSVLIGPTITYGLSDTDGSEAVTSVAISGVPTGATVSYTVVGGASVNLVAGVYVISGPQADIRATLNTLTLTPPVNDDANIPLSIAVTTTDADGSTATTTGTHTITVDAVADAPTGSGTAVGTEDSVPVVITLANTDTDGSQSITQVVLTSNPSTLVLTWTDQVGATVTPGPGGVYTITGDETAIRAVLNTLVATPPTNTAGTYSIDVAVTSTETNPTEAGEIATLSATTTFSIPVVANAEADAPTLATSPVSGNEDASITFGTSITYGLVDTDGSEVVSSVAISGVPTGAVIAYTLVGGASVTLVGGIWTITGPQADIRATLNTFAVTPGPNTDADFSISVAVTTTDGGVSSATTTGSVAVNVKAVADAPTVSATASGDEDSVIPLAITRACRPMPFSTGPMRPALLSRTLAVASMRSPARKPVSVPSWRR
jgi:hypothetical protein